MRRALALIIALAVLALAAGPVSASTTRRIWRASIGTSAMNGTAALTAYLEGDAQLAVNLKGLRRGVVYRIEVRSGTCAAPGAPLTWPGSFRTSTTGSVATVRHLRMSQMNAIWGVARTRPFLVRFVNGTSIRCGNFSFARATRVRVPSYAIDLPVIASPTGYPKCNVAMYQLQLSQPREPGVTFLFAHARRGMFLPLLNASKISNGAAMVGKLVYVYTSDSYVFTYRITQVRRHVKSIQNAVGITSEVLWLQTSEGPNSTYPKLVIDAIRIEIQRTTYAVSHPTAASGDLRIDPASAKRRWEPEERDAYRDHRPAGLDWRVRRLGCVPCVGAHGRGRPRDGGPRLRLRLAVRPRPDGARPHRRDHVRGLRRPLGARRGDRARPPRPPRPVRRLSQPGPGREDDRDPGRRVRRAGRARRSAPAGRRTSTSPTAGASRPSRSAWRRSRMRWRSPARMLAPGRATYQGPTADRPAMRSMSHAGSSSRACRSWSGATAPTGHGGWRRASRTS